MSQKISWNHLHDATLKTITVLWEESTAVLELVTSSEPYGLTSIRANGLLKLIVPHEIPWGISVSVNEANIQQFPEKKTSILELEMQSGDIIRVEAAHISLDMAE